MFIVFINVQLFQLLPNEYIYMDQNVSRLNLYEFNINPEIQPMMTEKEAKFAIEIDDVFSNLSLNENNNYQFLSNRQNENILNLDEENIISFRIDSNNLKLKQLESKVFKWIISKQHLKDNECPTKMYQCILNKCGFGCILRNELLMCAKKALKDGILFDLINYGKTKIDSKYGYWNKIFLPLSIQKYCTDIKKEVPNTKQMAHWIPPQFEDDMNQFHQDPVMLFHGILARYFIRLKPEFYTLYNEMRMKLYNKMEEYSDLPVIGIHIRRMDKSSEANLYPLIVYLKVVKYYLQKVKKMDALIILATDDKDIVEYILKNDIINKDKLFINPYSIQIEDDLNGNVNVTMLQRNDKEYALISIIFDMLLLSESDFFIGQDSSNVANVIVQFMSTRFYDPKFKSVSVDNLLKEKTFYFPYFLNGVYK